MSEATMNNLFYFFLGGGWKKRESKLESGEKRPWRIIENKYRWGIGIIFTDTDPDTGFIGDTDTLLKQEHNVHIRMRPVVLVCIIFWIQSRNEGGNGFFAHFQYKLLQDIIFKISKSNFRKTKLKFKISAREILDIYLFFHLRPCLLKSVKKWRRR